jgi:hypothetical protein
MAGAHRASDEVDGFGEVLLELRDASLGGRSLTAAVGRTAPRDAQSLPTSSMARVIV